MSTLETNYKIEQT